MTIGVAASVHLVEELDARGGCVPEGLAVEVNEGSIYTMPEYITERAIDILRADALDRTLEDMAAFQPAEVQPLCRTFRVYLICVPPPPSSGAARCRRGGRGPGAPRRSPS